VSSQTHLVYYQDVFKGGVTGAGYNPNWSSNFPGQLEIYIEPGSTIRKALLFVGTYNNPQHEQEVLINGTPVHLSLDNAYGSSYIFAVSSNVFQFQPLVIDISNIITPTTSIIDVVPPVSQPTLIPYGRYADYYILVAYDNPAMQETNITVVLNQQNTKGIMPYNITDINMMDLSQNIGFAIQSNHICDDVNDGNIVKIEGTSIGIIGGSDENNSTYCAGTTGSFYYQNNTLFGLSDDVANTTVNGTDAIANIESYLSSTTTIDVEFEYQRLSNPVELNGEKSNNIMYLFFAYSTPCAEFATTLSNDTTLCYGKR
jgi:hypothetical protein